MDGAAPRRLLLKQETEEAIAGLTVKVLDQISALTRLSADQLKEKYPFHAIFFPDEALPYAKQERTIVTKLGQSYYPAQAEIVAKDRYVDVSREKVFVKEVDSSKINLVNKIVDDLRGNRAKPNRALELERVLSNAGNSMQVARTIADLYIGDHEDGAMFVEIKSPLPNLDVCDESKRKMLTFLAMTKTEGTNAQAWFGLPYNPYGEGQPYKWSITKRIMDVEREVLIGGQLWEKIGGRGAFARILDVATAAKKSWME